MKKCQLAFVTALVSLVGLTVARTETPEQWIELGVPSGKW